MNKEMETSETMGEKERKCRKCGKQMEKVDRSVQMICEPPQVWEEWKCICGYWEEVAFEDDYLKHKINTWIRHFNHMEDDND